MSSNGINNGLHGTILDAQNRMTARHTVAPEALPMEILRISTITINHHHARLRFLQLQRRPVIIPPRPFLSPPVSTRMAAT